MNGSQEPRDDPSEAVDPEDFLRAMLHISAEDAEAARKRSPATRQRRSRERGEASEDGN